MDERRIRRDEWKPIERDLEIIQEDKDAQKRLDKMLLSDLKAYQAPMGVAYEVFDIEIQVKSQEDFEKLKTQVLNRRKIDQTVLAVRSYDFFDYESSIGKKILFFSGCWEREDEAMFASQYWLSLDIFFETRLMTMKLLKRVTQND